MVGTFHQRPFKRQLGPIITHMFERELIEVHPTFYFKSLAATTAELSVIHRRSLLCGGGHNA